MTDKRLAVARFVVLGGVLSLAACSSTNAGPTSPTAAASPTADAAVCGEPPGRYDPEKDPPAYCVREVTGKVVDSSSTPLAVPVSVCGVACFAGVSDSTGAFRIPVNARLPDNGYVLYAHGRPRHASTFVRLPASPSESLGLLPIELVPLSNDSVALPADEAPATVLTLGALRLDVPDAVTWDLTFEDLADDVEGRLLRWAKVPVERAPSFANGAALVYALAPFQAKSSKPIPVTITEPGAGGLAPGAAVELVVMRDGIVSQDNTGGLPEVAARGHVAADGGSITTDPGQGIQLFTWLAVRAAQ